PNVMLAPGASDTGPAGVGPVPYVTGPASWICAGVNPFTGCVPVFVIVMFTKMPVSFPSAAIVATSGPATATGHTSISVPCETENPLDPFALASARIEPDPCRVSVQVNDPAWFGASEAIV